jgi:hypothetical protein
LMDEEGKKDKLSQREIKYRVGWSRGTIRAKNEEQPGVTGQRPSGQPKRLRPAGNAAGASAVRGGAFTYRGLHRGSFAERVVWRRLPAVPARWTTALLWAAPAAGFALTFALVSALTRAP